MRDKVLEEAAHVVECMVVGGRAWTEEQQAAAEVLFAAAAAIRELKTAPGGGLQTGAGGLGQVAAAWWIRDNRTAETPWSWEDGEVFTAAYEGRADPVALRDLCLRLSDAKSRS